MDTLALGIIAIGVVAAIGVVLVAMSDSGTEGAARATPAEVTTAEPKQSRPRTRRRQARAPQVVPLAAVSAARVPTNGHASPARDNDPLVAGFLQVVSGELEALRLQQQEIDQRLKMIDGISALLGEMHASSVTRPHQPSSNSNGTGKRAVSAA